MRLQRLRAAAGMSQSKLAESAGVPVGTLRNWEQGRRACWTPPPAWLRALGVSLDELAGEPTEGAACRTQAGPSADRPSPPDAGGRTEATQAK